MNIDSRLSLVGSMEKAVLEGDQPSVERYLASDIRYTVGARPTVVGPRAVILAVAEQEKLVHWDGHTFIDAWLKDDALVVEVISRSIVFPTAGKFLSPVRIFTVLRTTSSLIGACTPTWRHLPHLSSPDVLLVLRGSIGQCHPLLNLLKGVATIPPCAKMGQRGNWQKFTSAESTPDKTSAMSPQL